MAVLDNGFTGYENEVGRSLPSNTQYWPGPKPIEQMEQDLNANLDETHGLYMAQILNGLLTSGGRYLELEPELHLMNARGYTNFAAAIEKTIELDVDIVIYSVVWEYGGNGDGRGFINEAVSRATDAGIIWLNMAGNFRNYMFSAPVRTGDNDWVQLPGPNNSVRFLCLRGHGRYFNQAEEKFEYQYANENGNCKVRVVLSWNDFKDDVEKGTDKDLDLVVINDMFESDGTSTLTQVETKAEVAPGKSRYPFEIVSAVVEPGEHFIRVKNRSRNFDSDDDFLRLTVSGDFIHLSDRTPNETLLPPADHPDVITVGASDSARGSGSYQHDKPDLFVDSFVVVQKSNEGIDREDSDSETGENRVNVLGNFLEGYNEYEAYKGTSNSTAMMGAAVAAMMAFKPDINKKEIIGYYESGPRYARPEKPRSFRLPDLEELR